MSNLLQHTAPIVRAVHVERVRPNVDLWVGSYAGDEWTNELIFKPAMPLSRLRVELLNSQERRGLPIVVFNDVVGERVA